MPEPGNRSHSNKIRPRGFTCPQTESGKRKGGAYFKASKVTQVLSVSATTAAYAAEAVKPAARVRGDAPADEAITLLSARPPDQAALAPAIARTKGALPMALMLISAGMRPPQESEAETLRRYLEFMREEENADRGEDREDETATDEEEKGDEIAAMLDQFIQGA
jgi:hypothetical protein